jgi:hypothetical protein
MKTLSLSSQKLERFENTLSFLKRSTIWDPCLLKRWIPDSLFCNGQEAFKI